MSDAVTAAAALAPATKWWLEPGYREQYAEIGVEHGQMAPKSWENRPDEAERFKKFLAGLNPLHHLPGVSTIYREITGEEIEPGQRILGGALFGGVLGLVSGAVNAVLQYATGKDIGGNAMALVKGGSEPLAATPTPAPAAPMPMAAAPQAVIADASAPLDLEALEAELTGEAAPPPLPKPPVAEAAATSPPVAAAEPRWFPARGKENSRGALAASGPTLSPAMLAQTQGRMPSAAVPRVGAGAYDQALELSRELQRHYNGMGVRAPTSN